MKNTYFSDRFQRGSFVFVVPFERSFLQKCTVIFKFFFFSTALRRYDAYDKNEYLGAKYRREYDALRARGIVKWLLQLICYYLTSLTDWETRSFATSFFLSFQSFTIIISSSPSRKKFNFKINIWIFPCSFENPAWISSEAHVRRKFQNGRRYCLCFNFSSVKRLRDYLLGNFVCPQTGIPES